VDISSLKMEIGVGEGEVGLISPGAPVEIEIPNSPDPVHRTEVKAVAAGADPATGSYQVLMVWPNTESESIKSGMTASVRIETLQEREALIVPTGALMNRAGKDFVFVAEEGQVTARELQLGRTLGNRTEVLSGLQEGELLIVNRLSTLVARDKVEPEIIGESGSWL
jgi:RND family efflux transporter MFP subunit